MGAGVFSLMAGLAFWIVQGWTTTPPPAPAAPAPAGAPQVAAPPTGAGKPEVLLRLAGSNTIGAQLAPALAGLAGGLEAHFTFMVAPSTYSFSRVVDMLVYAVVGGAGAFHGPVVGAAFLTLLPEVLREVGSRVGLQPGPLRLLVNGLVLLLVILYLPNGIVSFPQRLRERRQARRL